MAEDDNEKTKARPALSDGTVGTGVLKTIGPATQNEEEVDEFGLKVKHVKTRLYEMDPVDGQSGPEAKKDDDDQDEDEDGADGFKTPLTEPEGDEKPVGKGMDEEAKKRKETPAIADEHTPRTNEGEKDTTSPSERSQETSVHVQELEQDTDSAKKTASSRPEFDETAVEQKSSSPLAVDTNSADASRQHSVALSATTASPEALRSGVSEWSHMQLAPKAEEEVKEVDEGEWQTMPAYATHTIYDDWGKVLAKEEAELEEEENAGYTNLGGASKGYTKVQLDEDAMSATSMDDDTAYLFKQSKTNTLLEEDEEGRDMLSQMQATKDLLTEGQRIAYVGVVKIATMDMYRAAEKAERTRSTRKSVEASLEALKKWSQKIMLRLYGHMEIDSAEQVMIEQLAEHGVQADDLTPTLMQNARVRNPANEEKDAIKVAEEGRPDSPSAGSLAVKSPTTSMPTTPSTPGPTTPSTPGNAPAPYNEDIAPDDMSIKDPSDIANQKKIDIDLRWTVLCDLFLVLVADSSYDARSRTLLEFVGKALSVEWIDICRFEKRITDALEMQEEAAKENWNEDEHMEKREKAARNRKLVMMGLATVGGGLVIGLSAGLLAPVIGAGFAAGFTTIGVAGTSSFFGGAGAAALIASTGVISGSTIGLNASRRRMGAVKTFEYRPLHNNKRVNLIITIAGWMTGKVDDVRLPFSTVDPVMGDIYSVLWEPEMLQSMGQTINILATEALTQGLQQILGSTILVALMAALQLPIVLTKLAYLIDNPWNVSLARADQAGLILADSLMDRNLGSRPITLCGFSIGARVIYACLKELAKRNQYGLVQNVYLYGSPMVANKDDYLRARTVVSGRFLNGYATNDWILGYLFRATSGGIMRVAGLAPVEVAGIENVDVTQHVPGHMSYRTAMPKLLQEAGWAVEALEFNEIEDPDPDNHVERQRELINEIEEARKKLEEKPNKRGIKALFSRNKKLAEKKEWETYDERAKTAPEEERKAVDTGSPVVFDVDAILKEVAELSAQGVQIKEIESTLPPMKINVNGNGSPKGSEDGRYDPVPLRTSHSFNGSLSHKSSRSSLGDRAPSAPGSGTGNGNGMLGLTSPIKSKGSWWGRSSSQEKLKDKEEKITMSFDEHRPGRTQSPASDRPVLHTVKTAPAGSSGFSTPAVTAAVGIGAVVGAGAGAAVAADDMDHNAWADEDEFGNPRDGGMEMTFE
ncbi:hypothetical protein CAC42_5790 [Sphaceloma murrayae]|uniref:DUF726-domain-containing protein n=1 Tax=Sphaceloma murrayae TaxID=2082308 RepID=A0A2K1QZB2_9PEZI|nr:hypothetical protein CAC42_5790 [Sphaceloma murrayae]